jgi:hypothetical protein
MIKTPISFFTTLRSAALNIIRLLFCLSKSVFRRLLIKQKRSRMMLSAAERRVVKKLITDLIAAAINARSEMGKKC